MKLLLNIKLLFLVGLVAFMACLSSCKKDNNSASSDAVELLSFGPTGAKHGDTLRVIGRNLDKVTEVDLTGAVVAKTSFLTQTNELILFLIPASTVKGYITLKTPAGDIVSKTQLNLDVLPVVASMTRQARPGENITITGDYLNWVTQVTFTDNIPETTFVSRTQTSLVVKIPDNAKTGQLILSYSGTEPLTLRTDSTLIVTLPAITSMSPNPVLHATNVTITGTDLDLTKKVYFTGVSGAITTFVSQSATQLVVQVPAGTRKGKVTLEAASGVQTVSAMDLDVQLPVITTMSPNPITPGDDLTITGTNLNLVTSITFENAPPVTSFVSQTATQIVVTTPAGMARGAITLAVLNSTVTVQSTDVLEITTGPPPPVVALPFYDDGVTANWTNTGWIGGGWGGTIDYNNTSPVRVGTKSAKIDYVGGWGSPLQLGGASINMSAYTTFKISIYGGPGTAGKSVNIGINGADSYTIPLVEGTWTDYSIPISTLTSAINLTDIIVKEYSGTGGFTIYVDAMGLN